MSTLSQHVDIWLLEWLGGSRKGVGRGGEYNLD